VLVLAAGLLVVPGGCSSTESVCCGTCPANEPAAFQLSCSVDDLRSVVASGPCMMGDASLPNVFGRLNGWESGNGRVFVDVDGPGACHIELTFATGFSYSTDVTFALQSGGMCGACACGDYHAPTTGPFTVNNPSSTCVALPDAGADEGGVNEGGADSGDAGNADAPGEVDAESGAVPCCTPKTCADYPAGTCGPQSDGCGGLLADCNPCVPPAYCGGGGPNVCGGILPPDGGPPACVPLTCPKSCGLQCGPQGDGCGSFIECSGNYATYPNNPATFFCDGGSGGADAGTSDGLRLPERAQFGAHRGAFGDEHRDGLVRHPAERPGDTRDRRLDFGHALHERSFDIPIE
jgi:hypothetical protein